MELQGENDEIIVFSGPEQLVAELPESIASDAAADTAASVFARADRCAEQAAGLGLSPVLANRAQAMGLLRKAGFLRKLGAELATVGAPTLPDSIEAFLRQQTD